MRVQGPMASPANVQTVRLALGLAISRGLVSLHAACSCLLAPQQPLKLRLAWGLALLAGCTQVRLLRCRLLQHRRVREHLRSRVGSPRRWRRLVPSFAACLHADERGLQLQVCRRARAGGRAPGQKLCVTLNAEPPQDGSAQALDVVDAACLAQQQCALGFAALWTSVGPLLQVGMPAGP